MARKDIAMGLEFLSDRDPGQGGAQGPLRDVE
jgi:hypothetical protein